MDNSRCKASVYESNWGRSHQCNRKKVKDGYCKQHHPDAVKARDEKRRSDFEAKQKKSDWYRLVIALRRIDELEREIDTLKKPNQKTT